jgi:multisubunit Na+/H+ antiporter MnhE subunit
VVWLCRRFLLTGAPLAGGVLLRRLIAFPLFALAVVRDIVVGTWQVAVVVLGLRPLRHPGIVAVPIGERSRLGVAVSALATTLSPGSFLVDVDWQERVMLIHVLDATDPDAIRDGLARFYRRYQRHVFP